MSENDLSTVAVFYGTAQDIETPDLYRALLEWFSDLGLEPDVGSVSFEGREGKQVPFERAHARITRSNFRGVESFSLTAMARGGAFPTTDFAATAGYSRIHSYALVAAREELAELGEKVLVASHRLADSARPDYGVAYRREMRFGPTFYAVGVSMGLGLTGEDYDESLRISRWAYRGMKKRVYAEGMLRDVYDWNFLNPGQLERRMDGSSLADWIVADSSRGRLRAFTRNLTMWEVDNVTKGRVRPALDEAGILFR